MGGIEHALRNRPWRWTASSEDQALAGPYGSCYQLPQHHAEAPRGPDRRGASRRRALAAIAELTNWTNGENNTSESTTSNEHHERPVDQRHDGDDHASLHHEHHAGSRGSKLMELSSSHPVLTSTAKNPTGVSDHEITRMSACRSGHFWGCIGQGDQAGGRYAPELRGLREGDRPPAIDNNGRDRSQAAPVRSQPA